MADINIKLDELANTIAELQTLKNKWAGANTQMPDIVGGGLVVAELEAIGALYKELHENFITLMGNTILFLNNVKESFAASDQKAADAMTGN